MSVFEDSTGAHDLDADERRALLSLLDIEELVLDLLDQRRATPEELYGRHAHTAPVEPPHGHGSAFMWCTRFDGPA